MELELRVSFHWRQPRFACPLALGRVIRGGYLKVVTKHLDTRGYRQRRSADIPDICLGGRDQLRRDREQLRPCLIRLVYKSPEDQRNQDGGGEAEDQRLALNGFPGTLPFL